MLENLLLLFFTIFQKENIPKFEYILPTSKIPLNIYWISHDNVLLSYTSHSEIYNLENRTKNMIEDCKNCIYGYEGELLRCEYVHRGIKSMDELSTTISLYDSKDTLLFKRDLFPTVIPIVCKKKYIVLQNAYSFLERKTYQLNIENGELLEIQSSKGKKIDGLPEYTNISVGEKRLILLTEENLLRVYKLY